MAGCSGNGAAITFHRFVLSGKFLREFVFADRGKIRKNPRNIVGAMRATLLHAFGGDMLAQI